MKSKQTLAMILICAMAAGVLSSCGQGSSSASSTPAAESSSSSKVTEESSASSEAESAEAELPQSDIVNGEVNQQTYPIAEGLTLEIGKLLAERMRKYKEACDAAGVAV